MSAITIGGDLIHYEKLGRGRPVILIHGWVGSWRYWIPLMQKLHTKFSVYTLDLIGFGDSSKNAAHYDIMSQVMMLEQFLDQLGIPKAAIMGHGLGAMVATQFALRNSNKVARMLLTSLPLFDPGDLNTRELAEPRRLLTPRDNRYSLAPSIEDVMESSDKTIVNAGKKYDPTLLSSSNSGGIYTPFHELPTINSPEANRIDRDALRQAAEERDKRTRSKHNPLLQVFGDGRATTLLDKAFKRSEPEYEKLKADVEKSDDQALTQSAADFDAGMMLDDLRRVTAPIVAVHGLDDPILRRPSNDIWDYLTRNKEDAFVPIPLENVRHFPMLESETFIRLASDFLSIADIAKLELREIWRRRSR